MGLFYVSQTYQNPNTHLVGSSLKITKEKKNFRPTKSSNFIGHNIFFFAQAFFNTPCILVHYNPNYTKYTNFKLHNIKYAHMVKKH
jgi:hypothetical protein